MQLGRFVKHVGSPRVRSWVPAAALASLALAACSGNATPSSGGYAPIHFASVVAPASQYPNADSAIPTGLRKNLMTLTIHNSDGTTVGALNAQNGSAWQTQSFPGATSTQSYGPNATSTGGYIVVGSYTPSSTATVQNGYVYDSASNTYTTLDAPGPLCGIALCNYTIMHSSYGDSGTYEAVGNADRLTTAPPLGNYPTTGHAVLYNAASATWTNIDIPNAVTSTAYGIWIDGSTVAVAGGYADSTGAHAYVRDIAGSAMLVYDYPQASITHFEGIAGMGGAGNYNVVGDATIGTTPSGFILPIRNWKAGTPTLIGTALSANSVYLNEVCGIILPATAGAPPAGYSALAPTH